MEALVAFLIFLLIIYIIRIVYVIRKHKTMQLSYEKLTNEFEDLHKENEMLIGGIEKAKKEYGKLSIELKNKTEELYETKTLYKKRFYKIANRLIDDNMKWILSKLSSENYTASKDHIKKTVHFCEKNGVLIEKEKIKQFEVDFENNYEKAIKANFEKYEQLKIKNLIKEEIKFQKESEQKIKHLNNQQLEIEKKLNEALKKAQSKHEASVVELQQLLAEVQEKTTQIKSMAQMKKAGYIYVISNIGSYGNDIYKIGMTRRLSPDDKVKELSGESVPFPYNIHMIISSNNAPALEKILHKDFHQKRINKVNFRKDFFKVNIEEIVNAVKKYHGKIEYRTNIEASEYLQSINMSDDDFSFLTEKNKKLEDEYLKTINKEKPLEIEVGQNINGEEIISCPECGKSILVSEFQDNDKYFCPNCNTKLLFL